MDVSIILQSITSGLGALKLAKKLSLLTFPTWVLFKFLPNYYTMLKNSVSIRFANLADIIVIIRFTYNALVFINIILISLLILLGIAVVFQNIICYIASIFGLYVSKENLFRGELIKSIWKMFITLSVYIVSISIYSDLLLKYDIPLKAIYSTGAIWVSICPFIFIITLFIFSIIYPISFLEDNY
jgi:hypothetical protein